jgi:electron transport complex protein RnfC
VKTATFEKGIHPYDRKELSKNKPIVTARIPERAVIPLIQHIGVPTEPTVSIGDSIKRGQVIGTPKGFVSTFIHASISGKVIAMGTFPTPAGKIVQCVVIESDGKDEGILFNENPDYTALKPFEIRKLIRESGIVGLGGATFPSDVKLSPPKEKPIDTIIINGAECEPYLTADDRLMVERPDEIIAGLKIIMYLLNVKKGYIGIENNKPDAIASMEKAASQEASIEVYSLNVRYPQGAEKVLIKAITGREVPNKGGLPMDIGVVVHNTGTAMAVYEAIRYGKPLYERVVTVTGRGIKEPHNFLARIGTPVSELIDQSGGLTSKAAKIIMGGPMMGFAIGNLEFPVTKGTSGIVVMDTTEYVDTGTYYPCIRCGRCIDVCPMGLVPSLLSIFSEKSHYEDAKEYNLFDCFECGCCAYVCPSKRPIVQLIRLAKSMTKPN